MCRQQMLIGSFKVRTNVSLEKLTMRFKIHILLIKNNQDNTLKYKKY